jgi:AcrR family transcriptional regulator
MTQKAFFTREAIVEAAFTLTREKGWAGVTARNIARKLGSSTMPIYSSMKSMDEIEVEVKERAEALMLEYQKREYTENSALNMAVGYVTFARDERNHFRFLFVDKPTAPARSGDRTGGSALTFDQFLAGARPARLVDQAPSAMEDPRILKSWIFTHGLASLVSGGVLDLPDERIRSLLMESGEAFFGSVERREKGNV